MRRSNTPAQQGTSAVNGANGGRPPKGPKQFFKPDLSGHPYFSAFSGIGAAELGLWYSTQWPDGLPWRCVGYSEIDEHAQAVYRYHFPRHKAEGDITKIDYKSLPDFDLLIGGFPCQDMSGAGKRKGLKGQKSGLFYNLMKLYETKKPRHFCFENVESMGGKLRDAVTEIVGVEPVLINAAAFSAQQRERYFWCSWPVRQPDTQWWDGLAAYLGTGPGAVVGDILDVPEPVEWKDREGDRKKIGEYGGGGQGQRIYSPNGKSITVTTSGGGKGGKTGLYDTPDGRRQLTPTEAERLQSLPHQWTKWGCYEDGEVVKMAESERLKQLGNAFNARVARHLFAELGRHVKMMGGWDKTGLRRWKIWIEYNGREEGTQRPI